MSRVGSQPIPVAENVDVQIGEDNHVVVKGPRGTLERKLPRQIRITRDGDTLVVTRPNDLRQNRAYHGLSRSLLNNMVVGVTQGFTKTLEIQGVGYRAQLQGQSLQLNVGFSHPVTITPPEGITFEIEGPRITVSGIDKELVGKVAADIRRVRPPEPYKGKGIRYLGEHVRRKAGKSGKVGGR